MEKDKNVIRFISENIIVDRFPVLKEISEGKHSNCQVIINVSDEFYLGNSEAAMKAGKLNYYFPMGEGIKLMGLNSIYGALHVLHQVYTWNPDWRVLLHCQAGKNRSPTIRSAFYFMMIGAHEPDVMKDNILIRNNRLIDNCKRGHLPPIEKMELFLSKCKLAFDNPEKFLGGVFDWVMTESGLENNDEQLNAFKKGWLSADDHSLNKEERLQKAIDKFSEMDLNHH